MRFHLIQSDEFIVTHTGLALVGQLLSNTTLRQCLNKSIIPKVKGSVYISCRCGFLIYRIALSRQK